jgi:hypothetical protein
MWLSLWYRCWPTRFMQFTFCFLSFPATNFHMFWCVANDHELRCSSYWAIFLWLHFLAFSRASPPPLISLFCLSHPFLRNPMIPEYHVTPSSSWLCRYILWKARRASRSLTHGAWVVSKELPDVVRWCATICMRVIVWGRRVTTAELDVTETLLRPAANWAQHRPSPRRAHA